MICLRLARLLAGAALTLLALGCAEVERKDGPVTLAGSPSPAAEAGATVAPTEDAPSTPTPTPVLVSLDWLATNIEVPYLPSPFAAPSPDPGLQAIVESAVAGDEGSVSVVVHNLADGRYAAVDEAHVYYAASTYKLAVLFEAFRQVESGEQDFAKVLTLEHKYVENDLGTLEFLGLHEGDTLTLADALRAMIVVSDTPTAVLLQDTLGPERIDAMLESLGITETRFNNRDLPATARDMARLLEAVAAGEGVSGDSRLAMLSLLLQEEYSDGVISGVPEGTAVAHKTGSFYDATHDIALVWGPAGPYIIAVMTDAPDDWSRSAAVSAAVWQYFAEHP